MEQLSYNLLFRWLVGLNIDDTAWAHSTCSFNQDRLLDAEIPQRFFAHTVLLARLGKLVSASGNVEDSDFIYKVAIF
jgi:transposase